MCIRDSIVPVPWEREPPQEVLNYMRCPWRRESMPLIEYLRKTNDKGAILPYLRTRHRLEGGALPLERWADQAKTRGEKMIAAITITRNSDRFYGQWLMLNAPFRNVDDLWRTDVEVVTKEPRRAQSVAPPISPCRTAAS